MRRTNVAAVVMTVSTFWDYHIVAPATGSTSFELRDSGGNFLPSNTGCFLASVQGAFTQNDFNDGVGLNLTAGVWTFEASNGKSGWALAPGSACSSDPMCSNNNCFDGGCSTPSGAQARTFFGLCTRTASSM